MNILQRSRACLLALGALIAGLALAGAAQASEIYFANGLPGDITLTVDGGAPRSMPGLHVNHWALGAGNHTIVAVTADGQRVSLTENFNADDLADTHDSLFWCVIVLQPDKSPARLVKPARDWCKNFIDKGK